MFIRPTKEMVENALEYEGISVDDFHWRSEFSRGYGIMDYEGLGMLEVCRYEAVYLGTELDDVTDEDCAKDAVAHGFCKIIPVSELPKDFDRRYFGWVDTPENRKKIAEYCDYLSKRESEIELALVVTDLTEEVYKEMVSDCEKIHNGEPPTDKRYGCIYAEDVRFDVVLNRLGFSFNIYENNGEGYEFVCDCVAEDPNEYDYSSYKEYLEDILKEYIREYR